MSIMFTDIEDSTRVLQRLGDVRGERVFREHRALVDRCVESEGGSDVKWNGDGVMAVFPSAAGALRAATAMLRANATSGQRERLALRVGLSIGDVISDGTDYHGAAVVLARRLCDHAQPGQILATTAICQAAGAVAGVEVQPLGTLALKGLDQPAEIVGLRSAEGSAAIAAEAAMVAREAELRLIEERLRAAAGGHGSILFVAGEPGVGKSRLLRECAELAAARGVLALYGRTETSGFAPPFSPILDLLTSFEDAGGPGSLTASLGDAAPGLRGLTPRLDACLGPGPEREAPPDIPQVAHTLGSWLRARAREGPLALLLDDTHAAGAETSRFVEQLAGELASLPLLLVVAYRTAEAPTELTSAAERILREPSAKLVTLAPLDESGVDELVTLFAGRQAADGLRPSMLARSGGNPLFVRELLAHYAESGVLRWDGAAWLHTHIADASLPQGIRAVIHRRAERLSPAANGLLAAAAACLPPIDLTTVGEAAGLTPDEALAALDECLACGLLREGAGGLEFSHDVVREALLGEMSIARREQVHAGLAGAFLRARAAGRAIPGRTLAYHHREAGQRADQALMRTFALEAGEDALRKLALGEARAHFSAILESLPRGSASAAERAEAHHGLGRTLQEEGRLDEALAELTLAIELSTSAGAVTRTPEYLYYVARLHLVRFALADATIALHRANALLDSVSMDAGTRDRLKIRIQVQVAQVLSFQGRHAEAKEAADAAVALADIAGRPDQRAEALFARGMAGLQALRLRDAAADFAAYRRTAREEEHHIQELAGANRGAVALFCAGEVDDAMALAESARTVAERAGKPFDGALARITLAEAALLHGDAGRALALAHEGLEMAGAREPWTNGALGPLGAFAAWLQGDTAGAAAAAGRLLSRRERAGEVTGLTTGAATSLLIGILVGSGEESRSTLRHLTAFVPANPDLRSVGPLAMLAAAAVLIEDDIAAEALWTPLTNCAAVVVSPGIPFIMSRLEGGLARVLGKRPAALAALDRAELSATRLSARVEAVFCAIERGRLGQEDGAVRARHLAEATKLPGLVALAGRPIAGPPALV